MQACGRRLAVATFMVGFVLWAHGNPVSGQAADRAFGTWKLNLAKSKFRPGPPPKSLTVKIEAAGKGQKATADGVNAEGQSTHSEYTANYDGKDYPITGSPIADTVSLRWIDARTLGRTDKKSGKVVQTLKRTVSSDGKVLTATVKGTDPKGQPVNNVLVFEKQ